MDETSGVYTISKFDEIRLVGMNFPQVNFRGLFKYPNFYHINKDKGVVRVHREIPSPWKILELEPDQEYFFRGTIEDILGQYMTLGYKAHGFRLE